MVFGFRANSLSTVFIATLRITVAGQPSHLQAERKAVCEN